MHMETYITKDPLVTFQAEIFRRFTKYQKMTQRYSSAVREGNSSRYTVSPSINHTVLSEVVLYVKPKHVKSIKMYTFIQFLQTGVLFPQK